MSATKKRTAGRKALDELLLIALDAVSKPTPHGVGWVQAATVAEHTRFCVCDQTLSPVRVGRVLTRLARENRCSMQFDGSANRYAAHPR